MGGLVSRQGEETTGSTSETHAMADSGGERFMSWRSRVWQWEKGAQTSLRGKGRREKKKRWKEISYGL